MNRLNPKEIRPAESTLIDVREYPEYAAMAIPGSKLVPLGQLEESAREWSKDQQLVLVCRTGKRAQSAAEKLERLGFQNLSVLEGGMDGWKLAGLPVKTAAKKPWSLERQVRAIAGAMVLLSAGLGLSVSSWFFAWTLFVGAGLVLAGVTDVCLMASVLGKMPWNQQPGVTAS